MVYSDLYQNNKVLEIATITKLLRNLFLALLVPSLFFFKNGVEKNTSKSLSILENIKNSIPLFIIGFIVLIIIRAIADNYYLNSVAWINILEVLENVITILFGLALTALGASINLKKIFSQSSIPIVIGMIYSLVSFFTICILIFILRLNI